MKKSLVALALFGAFASVAQAQSSVVIYGALDANINKVSRTTVSEGQSDNNKLGFKGVEDLGNGLKALFQLEMRFNPDTGTVESGTRPLFQGESRVGLQGAFGTVRLGRGKTAFQDSSAAFEPWSGRGNANAGFQADMTVAGFNSDPLGVPAGSSSKNRVSNGAFYNTPVIAGFQANVSVATKETNTVGVNSAVVPYSATVTYNMGIVAAMAAAERNAIEDKVWSLAASVTPIADLKLMASYQKQNAAAAVDQKAWVIGANYVMGNGKFLAGYGQQTPDTGAKTKRASIGYEYSLSKRTYVYAEASNKKVSPVTTNYYGVGIHHNF
jgi:predicted porin